jgi:hypothetical protein
MSERSFTTRALTIHALPCEQVEIGKNANQYHYILPENIKLKHHGDGNCVPVCPELVIDAKWFHSITDLQCLIVEGYVDANVEQWIVIVKRNGEKWEFYDGENTNYSHNGSLVIDGENLIVTGKLECIYSDSDEFRQKNPEILPY